MLALTRKKGEALVINNNIEITVLEIRGDQIKSVFLLQRMYQFTEKKYIYRSSRKMRLPSVQMVWMR